MFITQSVPDGWEDLYGEPFETRECVYGFTNPIQYFSSEELISTFLDKRAFVNPQTGEVLTKDRVDQLEILAKKNGSVLESIIRELKSSRSNIMTSMKELSLKNGFKDCLLSLLEAGMLMRGWSGHEDYPLKESQTDCQVDQINLGKSLLEFNQRLSNDWVSFRGIHLAKLNENEWKFEDETVGSRLETVLEGKKVESCIRMTSGRFARTAWYYLNLFFQERPFELNELENII